MKTLSLLVLVLVAPLYLSCDRIDELGKVASGRYEVITTAELAQLKKDADIGKNVGRYSLHKEGFRTWRLDSATGKSCLVLTTDDDWKKPEIALQACGD